MVNQKVNEVLNDLDILGNDLYGDLVNGDDLHSFIIEENKVLNIFHLNIRSVKKNFDELLVLLQSYKLTYCDVIILSECFQITSLEHFNIPGYLTYYNNADYNKNDGVLIFIKSYINANISHKKLPKSKASLSKITLKIKNISFGITTLYKPPPIPEQLFIEDIINYFSDSLNSNIEVFVGDININISNKTDKNVNDYLSMLGQFGFVPYIGSPTRITIDSKSCIDHIFVRKKLKSNSLYFKSFIIEAHITDHFPVMLNIDCEQPVHNINKISACTYTNFDHLKFQQLIDYQDWSEVLHCDVPDIATTKFINTYLNLMELCKTIITKKIKIYNKIKPWITNGIVTSIKFRDKLKKKLLKNFSLNLQNEYRTYRNNLNKVIAHAKSNYYYKKNRKQSK